MSDQKLAQEGDVVTLCCAPWFPCCPKVRKENENFFIKDDYGGEICLPANSIDTVINLVNETSSLHRDSLDT